MYCILLCRGYAAIYHTDVGATHTLIFWTESHTQGRGSARATKEMKDTARKYDGRETDRCGFRFAYPYARARDRENSNPFHIR